jgi:hypothetical protein
MIYFFGISILDSLLQRKLFFPRDLFSLDDPGFDHEEDARNVLEDDADESEAEGPREVVVLPVGHKVAAVAHRAEDDQGNGTKNACTRFVHI